MQLLAIQMLHEEIYSTILEIRETENKKKFSALL